MSSIAIFEDKKGFTKVLEFAILPPVYRFFEKKDLSVWDPEITLEMPKEKILTFFPENKKEELYGQVVQKYYQGKDIE